MSPTNERDDHAAALEVLDGLEDLGFEVCSRYGDADATRRALGGPPRPWWRRFGPTRALVSWLRRRFSR